jgi:hypothetical protein
MMCFDCSITRKVPTLERWHPTTLSATRLGLLDSLGWVGRRGAGAPLGAGTNAPSPPPPPPPPAAPFFALPITTMANTFLLGLVIFRNTPDDVSSPRDPAWCCSRTLLKNACFTTLWFIYPRRGASDSRAVSAFVRGAGGVRALSHALVHLAITIKLGKIARSARILFAIFIHLFAQRRRPRG